MDPDDASAVGSHMDCTSMDEDAASMEDEEAMIRESAGLLGVCVCARACVCVRVCLRLCV